MGLWKYKEGWPDLWEKMLRRVDGVNTAGLYALTDVYGTKVKKPPEGMTWQQWTFSLLDLYRSPQKEEIAGHIARAIKFHKGKTRRPIPDDVSDPHSGLSWQFIALMVARGDLKGRKIQMLARRAMIQSAKQGKTPQEVFAEDLDDNSLV